MEYSTFLTVRKLKMVLDTCEPEDDVRILVAGNSIDETMSVTEALNIRKSINGDSPCLLIVARD